MFADTYQRAGINNERLQQDGGQSHSWEQLQMAFADGACDHEYDGWRLQPRHLSPLS